MNKYYTQKLIFNAKYDYKNRCWIRFGGCWCLVTEFLINKIKEK